jgi:hypothetical protein
MQNLNYKLMIFILLFSTLMSIVIVQSFASQEIHVYSNQSIENTIKTASSGSTIVVHQGDYPTVNVSSINPSNVISIKTTPSEQVSIDGLAVINSSNLNFEGFLSKKSVAVTGSKNIVINKFSVIDAQSPANKLCPSAPDSIAICGASSNITVSNSVTKNTKFDPIVRNFRGVKLSGCDCTDKQRWLSNIKIINNEFTNSWDDLVQVVGVDGLLIENNYIHDHRNTPGEEFHSDGIQVVRGSNIKILRNKFILRDRTARNDQAIIVGNSTDAGAIDGVVIANNLIHHWAGSGITIHGAHNVDIVNNTSVDNFRDDGESYGILFSRGNSDSQQNAQLVNIRMWNNIFSKVGFDNTSLSYNTLAFASNNMAIKSGAGGNNIISGSPNFVSTEIDSPDAYKISENSGAINAGLSTSNTPQVDIANNVRSNPPSIGAYEYNKTPTKNHKTDFNSDDKSNITDLAIILANYGKNVGAFSLGDCNGNGSVDVTDLAILLANYQSI